MSKDGYVVNSPKLPNHSMLYVYSVILEYKETQEVESISRHTIIGGGSVRNT